MRFVDGLMIAALAGGLLGFSGCGTETAPIEIELPLDEHAGHDHAEGEHSSHDHSGWWCTEHGVPEAECALCDSSLIADFKAKDDWCDDHNRPASQCYKCDPTRLERFAARYEAKFGEQPPQPTD